MSPPPFIFGTTALTQWELQDNHNEEKGYFVVGS